MKATIILSDGDRTLTIEDSSGALGYKTHLFDGNFYTGFQAWRHAREMADFISLIDCSWNEQSRLPVTLNADVADKLAGKAVVLTSGYFGIWKEIASELKLLIFHGEMMSAEAKFFITKYLQEAGRKVVAYGDGMIDYYMMKTLCMSQSNVYRLLQRALERLLTVYNSGCQEAVSRKADRLITEIRPFLPEGSIA